jgi:hypothetical protein
MALPTAFEKLQYNNEKNILIQGLPSSIEKQFAKASFAKSVTPLLRVKKIEFALIFAVSKKQLTEILNDVVPALQATAKLWISYPKPTAKISSDLCRDPHWKAIEDHNLEAIDYVELDNVWCASNFKLFSKSHPSSNSIPRYMLVNKEEEEMVF